MEGWLISIKHTAGFRDVKEQFFGSFGMLETARTYYKLHGPIANSPYKNADDLTDSSLIERRTSKREITIDAVEAFFASIRDGKALQHGADRGQRDVHVDPGPDGVSAEARSHLGRDVEDGIVS